MSHDTFFISKHSGKYLLTALFVFFISVLLDCEILEFITGITSLVIIYIFRNPERELPKYEANVIVSPVDGVIDSIEELNGKTIIMIKVGCFDSSILRAPINGIVDSVYKYCGARLSRKNDLANCLNEQVEITYKDANKNELKVKHLLTQSFADLVCDSKSSIEISSGERCGVMVHGLTTITLATKLQSVIVVGSKVEAGITQISEF
jgi:phosphatidylserine decarboxylase